MFNGVTVLCHSIHTPPPRTLLNSMYQPLEVIPTDMETFGVNKIIIVPNI